MNAPKAQAPLTHFGVVEQETFTATEGELALIEEGLKDIDEGRIQPFESVMKELRRKYAFGSGE